MEKVSIYKSKDAFNRFFQKDLYGQYDSAENIILSRGSWRDEAVRLPAFFKYCINYTLDHNWIGYSDSLGHDFPFEALNDWVNMDNEGREYSPENYALTLGNVATMGLVFRQLKERFPNGAILTLEPYYPSILKSVSKSFDKIETASSLHTDEMQVYEEINDKCVKNPSIKILLLSNFIGVEGRIFSPEFWKKIFELLEERDLMLVIDEGLWLERLKYPPKNKDRVIQVVSTSKKYGNPGMKMGYMIGPQDFIKEYYDQASTSIGGPPSIFFLVAEFLYQFEHSNESGDELGLQRLSERYKIDPNVINKLFFDFQKTLSQNRDTYVNNVAEFTNWLSKNKSLLKKAHIFQGINFFVEPDVKKKCYDLFIDMIQDAKVSVFPSICLGDMDDKMCRVTVLERQNEVKEGLKRVSDFLIK